MSKACPGLRGTAVGHCSYFEPREPGGMCVEMDGRGARRLITVISNARPGYAHHQPHSFTNTPRPRTGRNCRLVKNIIQSVRTPGEVSQSLVSFREASNLFVSYPPLVHSSCGLLLRLSEEPLQKLRLSWLKETFGVYPVQSKPGFLYGDPRPWQAIFHCPQLSL